MTAQLEAGSTLGYASAPPERRLLRLVWITLGYTLLVILFGAVVRITGSGAGCGQHWPTCQGEVVPLPRSLETAIELGHRLTSGVALVLVVAVLVLARRRLASGHPGRFWAAATVAFMLAEALIGAALVLLALVGGNDSLARAVVMSLHLVNTSLLLAALALTAWTIGGGRLGRALSMRTGLLLLGALLGVLVVSTSGAVTALGDTLYPSAGTDAGARLVADQAAGAHFLRRLRVVHPVLACAVALLLLYAAPRVARASGNARVQTWVSAIRLLVAVQLCAGFANIALSAPGWLQVLHLALASLLWLSLVLLSAESLARPIAHAPN